jgi:hypothetical protein
MDFPGLDVKSLTDDEIMRRISEIHGKLLYAFNFSGSQELTNQMQAILETLEFEQQERASRRVWDSQQKRAPKVIETDPSLVEKKEVAQTSKKSTKTGIKGGLLQRSKTPTADSDGTDN